MGASPARAKCLATIGDGVLRIGMGAAVGVCTMGASVVVNSFEHIAPMVGAASTILQTAVDLKHNRSTSKVYAESMDEIDRSAEKINTVLSEVEASPEDRAILEAAQKEVRANAAITKDLVRSMPETTTLAVPTLVVTGTVLAQSFGIDLSAIGGSSGPAAYAKHGGGSLGGFSQQQPKNPAAIS